LCPGHILLFGHVKILILSLLSKSLPIKGREARLWPRKRKGTGFMPRSTSTSSTASDGAASSSAAGGGEETTDGANRKKLTSQEKDKVREQKKSFSKSMYAMAVAYLKKHLERLKTEGRGDCWLLTIMAGFEVTDPDLIKSKVFSSTPAF
jgi:hypothetical protein